MTDMNKAVRSELYLVEETINKKSKGGDDISLMIGKGGILLFYESLYKLTNDSGHLSITQKILEDIFDIFNDPRVNINFSFCTGLSGLAYSFHILFRTNPIRKKQLSETLLVFDKLILEHTINNIQSIDDIDFLHGSLGASFYLNERFETNPDIQKGIQEIFKKTSRLVNEHILYLDSLDHDTAIENFPFGLAHGCASLIIVLSKALNNNPTNAIIRNTLVTLTSYLLKFKNNNTNNLSVFPSNLLGKIGYQNPLSWCRGDQGLAYAIFKASESLKDSSLLREAKEIAQRTLKRDSLEKSVYSVRNCSTGFCHGISSIAYLHKKSYSYTGDSLFLGNYYSLTKELLKRKEDYCYIEDSLGLRNKITNDITLLNGLTGIGLYYIDFLKKNDQPIWEGAFLLD